MDDSCIPNINAEERRKRLGFGLIALVLALVVLAGLIALNVNPWWRLAVFPLYMGAASGYFQWRNRT